MSIQQDVDSFLNFLVKIPLTNLMPLILLRTYFVRVSVHKIKGYAFVGIPNAFTCILSVALLASKTERSVK